MTKQDKTKFSKKQIKAAEMLVDPTFQGTVTELCQMVGVSRNTFYRWMNDDKFKEYLNSVIDQYADGELPAVWKALISKCKSGDVQAIKLYFELKGKYQQTINHTTTDHLASILDALRGDDE